MPWICAWICANTPDDKLVGVRWPFKYCGVVSVETSFQLNHRDATAWHLHRVIVPVGIARWFPFSDEASILHIVQNMPNEVSLISHGCRELPSQAFDGAAKEPTVVELILFKAMAAELVSSRPQDL